MEMHIPVLGNRVEQSVCSKVISQKWRNNYYELC